MWSRGVCLCVVAALLAAPGLDARAVEPGPLAELVRDGIPAGFEVDGGYLRMAGRGDRLSQAEFRAVGALLPTPWRFRRGEVWREGGRVRVVLQYPSPVDPAVSAFALWEGDGLTLRLHRLGAGRVVDGGMELVALTPNGELERSWFVPMATSSASTGDCVAAGMVAWGITYYCSTHDWAQEPYPITQASVCFMAAATASAAALFICSNPDPPRLVGIEPKTQEAWGDGWDTADWTVTADGPATWRTVYVDSAVHSSDLTEYGSGATHHWAYLQGCTRTAIAVTAYVYYAQYTATDSATVNRRSEFC